MSRLIHTLSTQIAQNLPATLPDLDSALKGAEEAAAKGSIDAWLQAVAPQSKASDASAATFQRAILDAVELAKKENISLRALMDRAVEGALTHAVAVEPDASPSELREALFGEAKDYLTPVARAVEGSHALAPKSVGLLRALMGGDDILRAEAVRTAAAKPEQAEAVAKLLIEYLDADREARASSGGALGNAVLDAIARLATPLAQARALKVVLDPGADQKDRRRVLAGLQKQDAALFGQAIDQLLIATRMTDRSSEAVKLRAYLASAVFWGGIVDDAVANKIRAELESGRSGLHTPLIEALEASKAPEARATLFSAGLGSKHPETACAAMAAVDALGVRLTDEEEKAVLACLKRLGGSEKAGGSIRHLAASALRFTSSEAGVEALVSLEAKASLSDAALQAESQNNEALRAVFARRGVGPMLLDARYKTTYWGVPQRYHPQPAEIEKEIQARMAGAWIVSGQTYATDEARNAILDKLWDQGIDHRTLGEEHRPSRRAAARAILAILEAAKLAYAPDVMDRLERYARGY
ncbi:MAG: hypothetical protein IT384_07050 [Deltaproteobacteria bacterium]|nr:hypothetical protein [Deltaproteobacteria bacterium]